MTPIRFVTRDVPPRTAWALEQAGVHPLLARLFAARGVRHADELDDALARLLPPAGLRGAARRRGPARRRDRRAAAASASSPTTTATARPRAPWPCAACACSAPTPATLCYVVPDRRVHGYGLTPQIVELALAQSAEVLITVDNGIASLEGVAHAQARGTRRASSPTTTCRCAATTASSFPRPT